MQPAPLDPAVRLRPRAPADGATFLTIYIALIVAIPSRLQVPALGGAGSPASILGLAGLGWWLWHQIHRTERTSVPRPLLKIAMGVFLAAIAASYVAGMARPIGSDEASTADLALIGALSWLGVVLIANDGVPTLNRLSTVLRRLALAGGVLGTLGIVQFVTRQPLVDHIVIPGLAENQALIAVLARDGFARPAGTAIHPIEFGVVLAMLLPIALTVALSRGPRSALRRWFPVAAIAVSIVLSISRSAIIGALVGILVLAPTWTRVDRRRILGGTVALLPVVFLTVPGMLGTLAGLFTGIGSDSSALSRTESYGIAWEFFQRAPILGRGFGTFLPRYRIFDNQYLLLLVEVGVVGLLATLGLLGTAVVAARRARRLATDPPTKAEAQALAAAVAVGACSLAFFDAFSFPMASGVLFLLVGLTGGLHRVTAKPFGALRPGIVPELAGAANASTGLWRGLPRRRRAAGSTPARNADDP